MAAKQYSHTVSSATLKRMIRAIDQSHDTIITLSERSVEASNKAANTLIADIMTIIDNPKYYCYSPSQKDYLYERKISTILILIQSEIRSGNTQKSVESIEQILADSIVQNTPILYSKTLLMAGTIELHRAKSSSARAYFEQAMPIFTELQRHDGVSQCLYNIAVSYSQDGEIGQAYNMYQRTVQKAQEYSLVALHVSSLNGIGSCYEYLGLHDSASETFRHALEIATTHTLEHSRAQLLNNLSTSLYYAQHVDEAIDTLHLALDAQIKAGNTYGQAHAYYNFASCYFEKKDVEKAREFALLSIDLFTRLGHNVWLVSSHALLGEILAHMSLTKEARRHLQTAYRLASSIPSQHYAITSVKYLKFILDTLAPPARSKQRSTALIEAEKIYTQTKALLSTIEHTTTILEIEILGSRLFEYKKQYQKALLCQRAVQHEYERQHSETSRKRMDFFAASMNAERKEYERTIAILKAQQLQQELEQQQQEISTLALHLVQKQELISSLTETIQSLRQNKSESIQYDDFPLQSVLETLERETQASERDWSMFKEQFEHISQQFIHTIARAVPSLTLTERKLCALLRLQLSTKDIAQILHISSRAVEKHRLNIRKKIGIEKDTSLTSYMVSLT